MGSAALSWAESEAWLPTDEPCGSFVWPTLPPLSCVRSIEDIRSAHAPDIRVRLAGPVSLNDIAQEAPAVRGPSAPQPLRWPFVVSLVLHAGIGMGGALMLPAQAPKQFAEAGGQPVAVDVLVVGAEEADALLEGAKPQPPLPMPVSATVPELESGPPVNVEPTPMTTPSEPVLALPMPDLPSAPIFPLPNKATLPETMPVEPQPSAQPEASNSPVAPKLATPRHKSGNRTQATPTAKRQPIGSQRTQPDARGENREGEASRSSIAQRRGGSGGAATTAGSAAMTSYRSRLVAHLTRHKSYPEQAQERGIGGRNAVTLTLSREGRVLSAGLTSASGHALLDSATLAAVRRAQPFPAIPDGGPPTLTVTIGLHYQIQ